MGSVLGSCCPLDSIHFWDLFGLYIASRDAETRVDIKRQSLAGPDFVFSCNLGRELLLSSSWAPWASLRSQDFCILQRSSPRSSRSVHKHHEPANFSIVGCVSMQVPQVCHVIWSFSKAPELMKQLKDPCSLHLRFPKNPHPGIFCLRFSGYMWLQWLCLWGERFLHSESLLLGFRLSCYS